MKKEFVIVFFDGYCNLCNSSVDFIMKHEKQTTLKFASLQSTKAQRIINASDTPFTDESVIVYTNGKLFAYSDAAIIISKHLKTPYSFLQYLRIVPRSFRDRVYKYIAKNRYRWFGKRSTCRIPTEEEKERFLT